MPASLGAVENRCCLRQRADRPICRTDLTTVSELAPRAPGTIEVVTGDQAGEIKPGNIYEDCAFHPVLCTFNDGDEIRGISLIDATEPRACSIGFCGVIKLSVEDVIEARRDWPAYRLLRETEWNADAPE
jgi:hypothetical protein